MHFPDELIDVAEFKEPRETKVGKPEMNMAKQLIESMTSEWKPLDYTDDYKEQLETMIEEKSEKGDEAPAKQPRKKKASNVIDLVSILQKSIQHTESKKPARAKSAPAKRPRAKSHARKAA